MRALLAVLCLAAVLVSGGRATAHAQLVAAEPAAGAVLEGAPAQVDLRFNEPVAALSVRWITPEGEVIEIEPKVAGTTLVASGARRARPGHPSRELARGLRRRPSHRRQPRVLDRRALGRRGLGAGRRQRGPGRRRPRPAHAHAGLRRRRRGLRPARRSSGRHEGRAQRARAWRRARDARCGRVRRLAPTASTSSAVRLAGSHTARPGQPASTAPSRQPRRRQAPPGLPPPLRSPAGAADGSRPSAGGSRRCPSPCRGTRRRRRPCG